MKRALLTVMVALLLGIFAQPSAAQEAPTAYDYAWLQEVVAGPNPVDAITMAWMSLEEGRSRSEGRAGTFGVPANSVVVGIMITGNNPAFELVDEDVPNVWFTRQGGSFGTASGFRAFQLDGSLGDTGNPASINEILDLIEGLTHDEAIEVLDVQWSNNPNVVNRHGSMAGLEILTDVQLALLRDAGQPVLPVRQQLAGNYITWGQLSSTNTHSGLVAVMPDIYVTSCDGGYMSTDSGYRAMQFEPALPDSRISDLEGCAGLYPPLDPTADLREVQPLALAS